MNQERDNVLGEQRWLLERVLYTQRLFVALSDEAEVALHSAQWRVGKLLSRCLSPVLGSMRLPDALDELAEIQSEFDRWRAAVEARQTDFAYCVQEDAERALIDAETAQLQEDLAFAFDQYDALVACLNRFFKAPCFRWGEWLLAQVSRLKRRPGNAGFLTRIATQQALFEQWRTHCGMRKQ